MIINNIEIYDIVGRKIINYQIPTVNYIDVSNLHTGIYIIKFYTDKKIVIKKIIKE